jgi:hypothetical protein
LFRRARREVAKKEKVAKREVRVERKKIKWERLSLSLKSTVSG